MEVLTVEPLCYHSGGQPKCFALNWGLFREPACKKWGLTLDELILILV